MRVKVSIRSASSEVVTPALVNSGYEAGEPEILLPISLAVRLGLLKGVVEDYVRTPIGAGRILRSSERVDVKILAGDRESRIVRASVTISEFENEVLISDYLASELGIAVEDFREGLWRFRDEPPSKPRPSEKPRRWP